MGGGIEKAARQGLLVWDNDIELTEAVFSQSLCYSF